MNTPMDIPIMVFFGTKGGVGKTTITSKFAEFVSYGKGNPNVLMIDLDVDHRGLTVLWTKGAGFSGKTIHDYMLEQTSELDKLIDVSDYKKRPDGGKLFLIPSAHKESSRVFQTTAGLDYETLVITLIELIKKSIALYDISFIVIDCGPIINPYTAAAAHIADHAFIIGQNEPISYQSLANYPFKIKEFYQNFNSSKMSVILNKVRGTVQERDDVLAVIPFTIDIIDFSEGLEGIDEFRLALFDSHIKNMISKLFKHQENYIPDYSRILPPSLSTITPETNKFRQSKEYKGLKMHKIIFPVTFSLLASFGLIKIFSNQLSVAYNRSFEVSAWVLVSLGIILITSFLLLRKHNVFETLMKQIEQGGGEIVAQLLQTQQGRAILNKFR
jgi:cellulose biosynthesis protein BcsQ